MKVKIHTSTYIVLLLSFLSGYFEYMYLLLLTIFIHESGHYFFSTLVSFKYKEIIIYPFGGLTLYNEDLNINTNKELISLLGGITFQLLFYFLMKYLFINSYITFHVFNIIKRINYLLLSFNFLPILPLDGGKLLNIILDKIFSYKLSNKISIIISIIFIIIFTILNKTYFSIILTIFLIKSIYKEYKLINYKYNKFIIERYINNYKFNKIKIINNINSLKRDNTHIINNTFERDYLNKLFDRKC